MLDGAKLYLFSYIVGVNFHCCGIVVVVPMGAVMNKERIVFLFG